MEYTYTELNLRAYYRRQSTLQPSEITRDGALRHMRLPDLEGLESRAAKCGQARINTLGDFEIVVKAVQ